MLTKYVKGVMLDEDLIELLTAGPCMAMSDVNTVNLTAAANIEAIAVSENKPAGEGEDKTADNETPTNKDTTDKKPAKGKKTDKKSANGNEDDIDTSAKDTKEAGDEDNIVIEEEYASIYKKKTIIE